MSTTQSSKRFGAPVAVNTRRLTPGEAPAATAPRSSCLGPQRSGGCVTFWLGTFRQPDSLKVYQFALLSAQTISKLRSTPGLEVFGPFQAPDLDAAMLKLRALAVSVGFRLPQL